MPAKNLSIVNALLRLTHYAERTAVLGPYVRSVVWVRGCCRSCPGCIAQLSDGNAKLDICAEDAARMMLAIPDTEGITISGGEPFLQAEALSSMIERIKSERDYGVIVYTGFLAEELSGIADADSGTADLLKLTDILIDGPYVAEKDDGKPYRGSSNQRIIQLTDRYADVFEDYYGGNRRKIEINVTGGRTFLVGVPSKSGLDAWKDFQGSNLVAKPINMGGIPR
jgi:anaerobic ribonucleoside-triphosphate reductase activating protein